MSDRPLPKVTPDAEPYWELLREQGTRSVQRCTACGSVQFYPRLLCVGCGGPVEQVPVSGRGSVYSFTVVHRPPAGFADMAPYAVALVDLDEGTRAMGRVVTDDLESVRIGTRVVTIVEKTDEGEALPQFALADGGH
ncbi:Zn-ribbon domain-containing OB-fold protein [Spirillospora sp. CA-142024]|uniref:Zn-ribbon domain-containing OB-fold protein n=1 Tax=Spirillospora sp. CA-142024 TaxID=3240036 RepID=UPI003D914067